MEAGQHFYKGDSTGNPLQPQGRHRENHMAQGVGLIPLGSRSRALKEEYGVGILEERDSIDKYSKYIGK